MRLLKLNFFLVDIGFIVYWLITYFSLIPAEFLYSDYHNPLLVVWNWSFFPLDIIVSLTGLSSLYLLHQKRSDWKYFAIISLSLTHASGLMAIAFWSIQHWFDLSWWLPNLYLLVYPIPALFFLLRLKKDF